MEDSNGLLQRGRHRSTGNGALLVIVNEKGSYWDRGIVDETIVVAMEHYGMPYRVLDLASERPNADALSSCAGIILAQDHLGGSLTESETALIAEAVKNGAGLVNFDNDLQLYRAPLLEIFGFGRINPHPFATNLIRIPGNDHYITGLQSTGEYHTFERMVTATIVEEWRKGVVLLAEGILGKDQLVYIRHLSPWSAFEPRNYPILFGAHWGKGKAVQFALNPRVWRNAFFGHARGIDDLFWRSILWTVRKPFAANMIPPFVTLSVDDCSGRHDFNYADIACKHNFIPLIALFLKTVPERLFPRVKTGLQSGKVQFSTHALDYNTLLAFNFGRGECTREELKERFAFDDGWWQKVGATPGATIRSHWGEWGVKSLPFCKERGRVFFCPALQTGLRKADMCMLDGFWPFDVQTCYYDYLPDDREFFAFSALLSRHQEDFLMGCTPNLRESERTDVEKAARNAAMQISHGLRACFHAEILTHEQKFDVLTLDEWDRILHQAANQTQAYEKIFASHDQIAHYLKGKDGVWIRESHVEGSQVRCVLAGTTKTPLRLSFFHDEENSVSREYRSVDPFAGHAEIG
jgi:hypothetical protein